MQIEDLVRDQETVIRLGFFIGVFVLMGLWEAAAPRRERMLPRTGRWVANLELVVLNTLVLRLLFPAAAVGMAVLAGEMKWGILNVIEIPYVAAVLASVVVLDFVIWLQHVMFHAIPALWRLHRVHHADLDIDVTTGLRFHTVEILLSMLIKLTGIALLGAPVTGVIVFEVLLNATSMFNHSNVRMPPALDRVLRWIVVTPDMHRVHHSIETDETNSNFGFNLPWWDWLFGTYRAQPRAGHEAMEIGISTFRDPRRCERFFGMLAMPFVGKVEDYAINRRRDREPE